jgi:hypothetical protein
MVGAGEAPTGLNACGATSLVEGFFTIDTATVQYFIVRNYGGDAFLMDRLFLHKNGEEVQQWGVDNEKLWCLSTESESEFFVDHQGIVEGDACYSSIRFDVESGGWEPS